MADTLDLRQIFISNLQLLGFDVGRIEAKTSIPFNKSMFDLPNKRGAEIVLHFLFSRLNPVMCAEEFRYCWPVCDKKQEQQFRKGCQTWLTNIAKEEPDAHLPRISASLFMSPGGSKFYQLLFHFSRYVLLQVMERENGIKDKDKLRYPVLTPQTESFGDVVAEAIKCSVVRHRKVFLDTTQSTLFLNKHWKDLSSELVREYRRLTKDCRELDHQIREEANKGAERGHLRGSPIRKRKSTSFDYDNDRQSIKRSQRLQDLREMWKKFDDFCTKEASEREVIESIVDRTMTKHKIDGSEINIKVPDLLLRECQEEIRRRHIDNTFQHGKLNLVSLIQLWNLCLHLYKERLHSTGVPNFTNDVESVSRQVHTSHAYVTNVQSLRTEIGEIIPDLKESIASLQTRLDCDSSVQSTPRNLRTTCVGLGLMEPSPGISFTPEKGQTGKTPQGSVMRLTPEDVSTPEAVAKISEAVSKAARRGKLFTDNPSGIKREHVSRVPLAKVPRKVTTNEKQHKAKTVDVRGQLQSTPTKKQPTKFISYSLDLEPQTLMSEDRNKNSSFTSQTGTGDISSSQTTPRSFTSNQSTPRNKSDYSGSNQTTPRNKESTPQNRNKTSSRSSHNSFASGPESSEVHRHLLVTPGNGGQTLQSQPSPSELLVNEILGLTSPVHQTRGDNFHFGSSDLSHLSPVSREVKKMFQEAVCDDHLPTLRYPDGDDESCDGDFRSQLSNRPHSPVAETLEHLEASVEKEEEVLHRQEDVLSNLGSPHSDSSKQSCTSNKENIPHFGLKQDDVVSDINSPRSHFSVDSYLSNKENDPDFQEVSEETSAALLSPSLPFVTSLMDDENQLTSSEKTSRSQLSDEIRKMFRDSLTEDGGSGSTPNRNVRSQLFNNQETGNYTDNTRTTGGDEQRCWNGNVQVLDNFAIDEENEEYLEETEMPDMLLNCSIDDMFDASPVSNKQSIMNFSDLNDSDAEKIADKSPPKPRFPLTEVEVDDRFTVNSPASLRMDKSGKYLKSKEKQEDISTAGKSSPEWQRGNKEMREGKDVKESDDVLKDWHDLENSMDQLDNLVGKSNDLQRSLVSGAGVGGENDLVDDLEIIELDTMDDSFVPLRDGFLLEGGTPAKESLTKNSKTTQDIDTEVPGFDQFVSQPVEGDQYGDILSRFQKLKAQASQIKQKYNISLTDSDI